MLARRLPVQDPQHRPAPRSAAMRNAASAGKSIRSASRLPNPQILPTPEVICFVCGFSTRDDSICSINFRKIRDSREKDRSEQKRGVERTTAPCPRTLQGPYGTEPHHAATGAKRGLENRTTAKPHRLPRRRLPHKLRLPLVAKHCGQARPAGSVPQTAIQHM